MTGTSYYWTKDHLSSIREMTDNTGVIQAQYSYDQFGRATKLQGITAPDFQFAGYYHHPPSGLAMPVARSYSSLLGRWLQREPLEETGGTNLFAFNNNSPANYRDLTGNFPIQNVDYPPGSSITTNAPPDVITIGGHGEPGAFSTTADALGNLGPHMTADAVAKALKDSGLISDGTSNGSASVPGKSCIIQLCICHGAEGPGKSISFAAALARATGCWVVACTGLVDPTTGKGHPAQTYTIPGTSITITTKDLGSVAPSVPFNPSGYQGNGEYAMPISDSDWGVIQQNQSLYGPAY